ncbi:MAG: hypothetical protein ABJN84_02365 [Flavobacteriaceae bacterium]
MKYIAISLVLLLTCCKAQENKKLIADQDIEDIVLIADDAYSGIEKYETEIIRDVKSLTKFYSRINRTRKPGLPVPVVDFSTSMVVAVCLGQQKGNVIPILKRGEESDNTQSLTLVISQISSKTKESSQAIAYPFYVFKMPISMKKTEIKREIR